MDAQISGRIRQSLQSTLTMTPVQWLTFMAYGRPSTPAPTTAVTLWTVDQYLHEDSQDSEISRRSTNSVLRRGCPGKLVKAGGHSSKSRESIGSRPDRVCAPRVRQIGNPVKGPFRGDQKYGHVASV